MKKETMQIAEKSCVIYGEAAPKFLLVQPVDEHDLEVLAQEVDDIWAKIKQPFLLAALAINDWNSELSPWDAPAVFGQEDFGHGAKKTLAFILQKLLPALKEKYQLAENIPVILGGYSLAGFFALWSGYQTKVFSAIAAASPSVWFPNWMDYTKQHEPQTKAIYLSLGDREERTRNQVMAQVGDNIRAYHEYLAQANLPTTLEWNKGNHFQHSDQRCAKAFLWCMQQRKN